MADLTKKYRLIWDISTGYIQNDYQKDWSNTISKIVNPINIELLESDNYQDILDKISVEGLTEDPSTFKE